MLTRHFWRAAGVLAALVVAAVSVVAAQSALIPPSRTDTSSSDQLLIELRGLRADFQQAAKVSLRGQLLVGRLQLQEQRINAVAGQLAEVRRQIGVHESGQIPMTEQLKNMEDALRSGNIPSEEQAVIDRQIPLLKAQLAQVQREEQQLRLQETDVSTQLTTEQGRWQDFNSRLDELENQLPVSPR